MSLLKLPVTLSNMHKAATFDRKPYSFTMSHTIYFAMKRAIHTMGKSTDSDYIVIFNCAKELVEII